MIGESYEHLIEIAKSKATEKDAVLYILNYFLQNVEYNYAYLFCAFMQEEIVGISSNLILKSKVTDNGTEYFFDREIKGNSNLFRELVEKYNKSQNINDLRKIVEKELVKHIDNPDIVEKETDAFINSLLVSLGKKTTFTPDMILVAKATPKFDYEGLFDYMEKQNSLDLSISITAVLCDYLGDNNLHTIMPPVIEDGLLKRGICRDYADYLAELFNEIGIEAYRIDGTSELDHAWVAARIDGSWKSIDLVRAVFIRDHYKGIPNSQTSEDWLLNDFDVCFEMQPTRSISSVLRDGNKEELPKLLTKDNYNQKSFEAFLDSLKINQRVY